MGRIPDRVIEEIRERAEIVQVVGRHVNLKKSGSRYWGLCPFHSEKTPSFQVHPDKQIFHCFGCGEGGDVFSFRMRHDGTDFLDTVRALAAEFGVQIPSTGAASEGRTGPLYSLNDLALGYFRKSLRSPAGARARAYLQERGVPQDLIDRFQLGFAPPGWEGLANELRRQEASLERAQEAGLLAPRQTGDGHYDRFRSRLIFPITEPTGRVVGFGGRGLSDETPKYINSPESPIYRKGRALFGVATAVDAIRQSGRCVVVEGYFDLIALHRAGIREGVAPCGTALTPEHAGRLRRYTRDIVVLFDGDEAGQRAAERSLPILSGAGLHVRAAFLLPGDDPDTLLAREGPAALQECVDAAVPLIDELIDRRLGMKPLHEWEAADLARGFAPLLAALPDEIERAGYERRIASRLGLAPATIAGALRPSDPRPAPAAAPRAKRVEVDATTRTVLGALGCYPELVAELDALAPESLPEGDSGVLLSVLSRALRSGAALTQLLSPLAEELSPELKSALSHIVAEYEAPKHVAARAVRDCVAQLRKRTLRQQLRSLERRRESCIDPEQEQTLFEQAHGIRLAIATLERQIRQGLTFSSQ